MCRWDRSREGRAVLSARAREREIADLARRAGCTPQEAAVKRKAGLRFCGRHGWYRQTKCIPCKCAKAREDRAARRKETD